jgi:hypothetical protein
MNKKLKQFLTIISLQILFFVIAFLYIENKQTEKKNQQKNRNFALSKETYDKKLQFLDKSNNLISEMPIFVLEEKEFTALEKDTTINPPSGYATMFLIANSSYFIVSEDAVEDNIYIITNNVDGDESLKIKDKINNVAFKIEKIELAKNLSNKKDSGIRINTNNSYFLQFNPVNKIELEKIKSATTFKIITEVKNTPKPVINDTL